MTQRLPVWAEHVQPIRPVPWQGTAQETFETYHRVNPHVLRLFVARALEHRDRGEVQVQAKVVWRELPEAYTACGVPLDTTDPGTLSSCLIPYYAQVAAAAAPRLAAAFPPADRVTGYVVDPALLLAPVVDGDGRSLRQVREEVQAGLRKGTRCPCCDRWAQVEAVRLTQLGARALCWLVAATGPRRRWVDVPWTGERWVVRANAQPLLRWWGLVESGMPPGSRAAPRDTGMWRPTARGLAFVLGRLAVPAVAYVYDQRVLGYSEARLGVQEAVGTWEEYEALAAKARNGRTPKLTEVQWPVYVLGQPLSAPARPGGTT